MGRYLETALSLDESARMQTINLLVDVVDAMRKAHRHEAFKGSVDCQGQSRPYLTGDEATISA